MTKYIIKQLCLILTYVFVIFIDLAAIIVYINEKK